MDNHVSKIWKGLYYNTMESFVLETNAIRKMKGFINGDAEGNFICLSYVIHLDPDWNVEDVHVDFEDNPSKSIHLRKQVSGEWAENSGKQVVSYQGCTDVDISLTPSTNTIPINRLNLEIGSSEVISVVYIDILASNITRAKQRYTRLAKQTYQYETISTGFKAILEVDTSGLVTKYPGLWESFGPH